MDLKMLAAQHAVSFIKNKDKVGLGAGSTIAFIVDLLTAEVKNGLKINFFTSSFTTWQLLQKKGFNVQSIAAMAELDIYLDGCDQFDKDLNALKSGGGIHTREKLLASMAKQFLLVGDVSKYSEQFDTRFPLVIELLPEAFSYVPMCVQKLFPDVKILFRMSDKKDGMVITENGNYLLDAWFPKWPNLEFLNTSLKQVTGVVETSLFYKLAHKAVIAGVDGIKIMERNA
ncbi:MAG: ribose 5-phosphate isomerase A [Ferruginibacter sp.]